MKAQFLEVGLELGADAGCRPPMSFCRKALQRHSKRHAELKARIGQGLQELGRTKDMMKTSIAETCGKRMPKSMASYCSDFKSDAKLGKIADRYLHDYSDDEICADLGKCKAKDLGISEGSWKISR